MIYGGAKSSRQNLDLSTETLDPSATGFPITGEAAGNAFGVSISNAGDVNKDGNAEIVIGANNLNKVYVVYGGENNSMQNIDLAGTTLIPSTTDFTITGKASEFFGASVSNAGDINNDGYYDIIIGAYGSNSNMGAAYVVYGAGNSDRTDIDLSSTGNYYPETTIFSIAGDVGSGRLGVSVDFSDLTGDGFSEILIGAPAVNNEKGNAYILPYRK